MLTAIIGVPSASKASTYHENKDCEKMIDLTFLSKGQLRRVIELQDMENVKRQKEIEALKNEEIRLREALQRANQNVSHYQNLYLEEMDKNRERKKDTINVSFLKVAG